MTNKLPTPPPWSPSGAPLRWLLFFFSPEGRVNRGAYWVQKLIMLAVIVLTVLLSEMLHNVTALLMMALAWSYLVVEIKRWHDLGRSGWWVFVDAIPIVGPIYSFLLLGFAEGNPEENPYGAPPTGIP